MALRASAQRLQVLTAKAKPHITAKKAVPSKKNAPVDWVQRSDHHLITIDLPQGLTENDFKVTSKDNEITVKTNGRVREELEGDKWHAKERSIDGVLRKFELPEGAKLDKNSVQASFERGILTLRIPTDPEEENTYDIFGAGQPSIGTNISVS